MNTKYGWMQQPNSRVPIDLMAPKFDFTRRAFGSISSNDFLPKTNNFFLDSN